jgi:serine/threonine-protein kinase
VQHRETTILSPGILLAKKYKVERVLSVGGMGAVYSVLHVSYHQRVVLRLLRRDLPKPVVDRLMREARLLGSLKTDHVVRVLDVASLEDGRPYIVTEMLEGEDLGEIAARGPLPIHESVDHLVEACEALVHAHARGVSHGDLRPANLVLARRSGRAPHIKVIDFGIPKSTDGASPAYLAPEQLRGAGNIDLAADVWSLGVIAYELLTRQLPFRTDTVQRLITAVLNDAPIPPSALRADVPPGLEAIVLRCLARAPDARFKVRELAAALAPFGSEVAGRARARIETALATGLVSTLRSELGEARSSRPAPHVAVFEAMRPASTPPPPPTESTRPEPPVVSDAPRTTAAFVMQRGANAPEELPRRRRVSVPIGLVVGILLVVVAAVLTLRAPRVAPASAGGTRIEPAPELLPDAAVSGGDPKPR